MAGVEAQAGAADDDFLVGFVAGDGEVVGAAVGDRGVGGGDPVGLPKMGADADAGGLLADVKMQKAGRFALSAGDLRRSLELAQQHHLFEQTQQYRTIG